ncbi:hypothetical protein ACMGD3_06520 [Lysinibacillus sphaericus]|uniref:hypothetical protein n=1 Tax=Lysinibacillus sphaericus TaxID=1421 RepID=UPI001C5CDDBB
MNKQIVLVQHHFDNLASCKGVGIHQVGSWKPILPYRNTQYFLRVEVLYYCFPVNVFVNI